MDKYLSFDQVKVRLGLGNWRLRWLCFTRDLVAKRLGDTWYVAEDSVEAWRTHPNQFSEATSINHPRIWQIGGLFILLTLTWSLLAQTNNRLALVTGARLTAQTVVTSARETLEPKALASNEFFKPLRSNLDLLRRDGASFFWRTVNWFSRLAYALTYNLSLASQTAINNWRALVMGRAPASSLATHTNLSEVDRLALRAEVEAEVRREFGNWLGQVPTSANALGPATLDQVFLATAPKQGMVVLPPPATPAAAEAWRAKIQSAFSDEVQIKFDESGQAGVITPIFRGQDRGGNYLFILTPIKGQ